MLIASLATNEVEIQQLDDRGITSCMYCTEYKKKPKVIRHYHKQSALKIFHALFQRHGNSLVQERIFSR